MLTGEPECSIGWEKRCALGTKKKCGCACGGANHGKSVAVVHLPAAVTSTDLAAPGARSVSVFQRINAGVGSIQYGSFNMTYGYSLAEGRADSVCDVFIMVEPGKTPVVIVTELEENTGTSVTNAIERIATGIYLQFFARQFRWGDIRWIEHYKGRGGESESYTAVTFEGYWGNSGYHDPRWARILKSDIYHTEPLPKESENEIRTIQTHS